MFCWRFVYILWIYTQSNITQADFHMFQNVSYENRISPNNLSDDQSIVDVDKISWLTFLPSAMEQTSLTE
jgi:hypothetical protein